ncbi:MAG: glycoside hydrolase family 5 protein [Oscillospiraceae bacterium]
MKQFTGYLRGVNLGGRLSQCVHTSEHYSSFITEENIGGIQWNSVHTLRLLDKPYDENIVFNFHFYEPFLFTHQSAPWLPAIPKGEMNYPATMERYRRLSEQINCFGSGLKNTDEMGAGFMELLIIEAVNAAENAGVPLYCREYGVDYFAPPTDTLAWFRDIHSVFEKYGIGRAVWTYKKLDFGITDEHYSSIFGELTKLL